MNPVALVQSRHRGDSFEQERHQRHVILAGERGIHLMECDDVVAADPALNQRDGIHPTAEGARIVADNVWAVLRPLIEQQRRGATRKEGPAGS